MFNQFVYQPIFEFLIFLNNLFGQNFGLAIISLTLVIRLVLVPLTLPALRSAQKMRVLKPKLDALKNKHSKDKAALQQAQLKLYKSENINPAAGCLPYIIQFIVLIALYRVFIDFLSNGNIDGQSINLNFLWFNLADPDKTYALPIITGLTQLILGVLVLPGADTAAEKTLAQKTKTKTDDKKAQDATEMAQTMQQQMVIVMPIMTIFLAARFPSALSLYWFITTLFSLVQQYLVSGWGGLALYLTKLKQFVVKK